MHTLSQNHKTKSPNHGIHSQKHRSIHSLSRRTKPEPNPSPSPSPPLNQEIKQKKKKNTLQNKLVSKPHLMHPSLQSLDAFGSFYFRGLVRFLSFIQFLFDCDYSLFLFLVWNCDYYVWFFPPFLMVSFVGFFFSMCSVLGCLFSPFFSKFWIG